MRKEALLDKLSEFLMVEQCGWQLYQVVGSRTQDAELREKYAEFGAQTDRHRTVLIQLIRQLGGDPDYVSPTARVAQVKSEALLQSALQSGPLSDAEREASDLENVLLAETKDHADWQLLSQLAQALPKGKVRTALEAAVAEVEPQEDEHLQWAADKLAAVCLEALTSAPLPERGRLTRCVIDPAAPMKAIHAAPVSPRSLLETARLPASQETPASRTARSAS
jgi:rubrerythrin